MDFGPILHAYTRAQALDDGVLVDLGLFARNGQQLVKTWGFKYHLAITAAAYCSLTDGIPGADQDALIRTVDLLLGALRQAIVCGSGSDRCLVYFKLHNPAGELVDLWCLCGPGDIGEPVLTVMLIGEG